MTVPIITIGINYLIPIIILYTNTMIIINIFTIITI